MSETPRNDDGPATHSNNSQITLAGEMSPGVKKMEALAKHFTFFDHSLLLFSAFLVAYAYSLDYTLSSVYKPYATADFQQHSLLATINVLQAVISAAAQPAAAKVADVFGRVELVLISIVFYIVGEIVEASSNGVSAFAAGAALYQIGHICIILAVYIIIADTTSLRLCLFCSYIPALPTIINTWVSGDVSSAVLSATTWRWGIGMWPIIYLVCVIPLLFSLWIVGHRAKKAAGPTDHRGGPCQLLGTRRFIITLFWELDTIGIMLLIAVFALILLPFTITSSEPAQWKTAKIIVPLVIGILGVPIWIYWESHCKHPMIPFNLLKDRTIWGALGIEVTYAATWFLQSSFLYTFLIVAVDMSIKSATRITTLTTFCCVVTGSIIGLIVFKVRRLKPLIIFGTILYLVAFGVLIYVRGSISTSASSIIAGQAFLGFTQGLFIYPVQVNMQAATKHENVAVIISLCFAAEYIGGALGNTIASAIWNQVLPSQLAANLGNTTEASAVFANPFTYVAIYGPETPQRNAIVMSYGYVQKLTCIVGISLCILQIAFACVIRNPVLGKEQSLPDAEEYNRERLELEVKPPWHTRFFN